MANNEQQQNTQKGGKNLLAYFKHLIKDPVNSIDEANSRKKQILPWLFGSIGVGILFTVLGNISDKLQFMVAFAVIGFFAAAYFGFLLYIINKAKQKFKILTCKKCNTLAEIKTAEEFRKYVKYSITKNEAVLKDTYTATPQNMVISEISSKAEASASALIELTCPHCGNIKRLGYQMTPFKCKFEKKNIKLVTGSQKEINSVINDVENLVKSVVDDYNDPDKRKNIPYTMHSVHHPRYEERNKVHTGNSVYGEYNGVTITYRKEPDEMVEQFFVNNQFDGKLIDLSETKK